MSQSSTAHEASPVGSPDAGGETAESPSASPALLQPVQAAAFWAGVGLPFLYLPLLLSGPGSRGEWLVAVGLIGLHVATLYLGHAHNR